MNKKKLKKYVLIIVCVYLFTYLFLSRASLYLNRQYEGASFYYIPVKEAVFKDYESLFVIHVVLYHIYYPLYWVDHNLFSGPHCAKSLPLWELK